MEVKEDGEGRQTEEAMCMWGRGASVKEADVRGVVWCELAWCECGVACELAERFCVQAPPDSFSLFCSLWDGRTHKSQQRKRESRTDAVTGTYVGISM